MEQSHVSFWNLFWEKICAVEETVIRFLDLKCIWAFTNFITYYCTLGTLSNFLALISNA